MSIDKSAHDHNEPASQGDGKGVRYSPELWKAIQGAWEADPTMSYAAAVKIVGERLSVPVPSKGACATFAKRNNWTKGGSDAAPEAPQSKPAKAVRAKKPVEHVQTVEHVGIPSEHVQPSAAQPPDPEAVIPPDADKLDEQIRYAAAALNPQQRRFADFYLISLNATDAYKRAGYTGKTDLVARVEGHRLVTNPNVAAYVAARQAKLQAKLEITQEMVLKRWWDIATANVNELVEYRRNCCRNCWGVGFAYQWTKEEFDKATRKHLLECTKANGRGKPEPEPPDGAGGDGFDRNREPNPECPECAGEGYGYAHYHDSRRLSAQALMLYDGVKITKEGIEVLKLDRAKALDNVARHIGMFTESLEVNITATSTEDLDRWYAEKTAVAKARQAKVIGRSQRLAEEDGVWTPVDDSDSDTESDGS